MDGHCRLLMPSVVLLEYPEAVIGGLEMQHHVIVSFGRDNEFEFKMAGGASVEDARKWFDHEFNVLGCTVLTPTGKILAVDRILSVAKYAGAARFRAQQTWAEQFAKFTAALLGRDLIRVDVEHYRIGY
jgi:hypothetical protein